MKKEDLIIGNIYIAKYTSEYIMKWSGNEGDGSVHINLKGRSFYADGSFRFSSDCKPIREATFEEKCWLQACIKANKFIPLDQVEMRCINYEIY